MSEGFASKYIWYNTHLFNITNYVFFKVMKTLLKIALFLTLTAAIIPQSCGTLGKVPVETNTHVNLKDSVVFHFHDSVRITEAVRYKDVAWLGDTLKLHGNRSRAWAVADTSKGCLVGALEEDKVEEHSRIVYKDRWKVRDSLVYKEVHVPVEVVKEVKVVPKFWRITGILGIILTCVLVLKVYLKVKKKV